jgi:two-component system CheB/CheR fusion protein
MVCQCDRVRLEQIVLNLIGNAEKFTPPGGAITVDLREEDGYARLSVADTGRGIAPEFLPHVFEMFSQAGGLASSGDIVGLALVDQLARAHGGRVEARSEGVGRGATFVVSLPLHKPVAAPTPAPSTAQAGLAGARILAVDDDAESLTTFAMLLQLEGAIVDTAPDGRKAYGLLAAKSYDLLISDVSMPGMDGLQLVAAARRLPAQRGLRAIAVTGHGRDVDAR